MDSHICPNSYELPDNGKPMVAPCANQEMAILGSMHSSMDGFCLKSACRQIWMDHAMSDKSAIQATFSDFRIVKSRKIAQLVCEVPLEQADAALATLGGLPQPASERWVALARLNGSAKEPGPPPKEQRRWEDLKLSMRASIRCGEPAFRKFLNEMSGSMVDKEHEAAHWVRIYCGVASRSVLDLDPVAAANWQEIDARYMLWLQDPQHA